MEEKGAQKSKLFNVIAVGLIVVMLIACIILFCVNKYNSKTHRQEVLEDLEEILLDKPAENKQKDNSSDVQVVASLEDEITTNSAWCGTFQLVWNDMVNNVVKRNVKFLDGDNLEVAQRIADNLNKQTFKEEQLSEKDYYKIFDTMSLELKSKIEKGIKEKFNETSDILDDIDWQDDPNSWVFYTMLKKIFNFENNFDELENDMFANKYEDVKYFGINKDSDSKLYSQVDVLYYNENNDFAVALNTKEGEQVILARGLEGNTFALMYNNMVKKANSYNGNNKFTENDYLKVPNIKLNTKRNYDELCKKNFLAEDGDICKIIDAIQTIQLDMNKSGGKIKSEAIIAMTKNALVREEATEGRYFNLNDEFTMFLKEKDKKVPYFAANIEDITLFQD